MKNAQMKELAQCFAQQNGQLEKELKTFWTGMAVPTKAKGHKMENVLKDKQGTSQWPGCHQADQVTRAGSLDLLLRQRMLFYFVLFP